ncbi:MAG: M48 family metallopeptidase [Proteobacteria bacterium]|nr:M48 family metallopeptidase [Pseudomonadota bacterium]MBI3497998.1 M48 family metallopeptidase [Pseudomonadota bacterium]
MAVAGLAAWFGYAPTIAEAQRLSLIRDAETENTIRTLAAPLFTTAGLNANDVHIYIIRDNQLNAFVAGGQNLFLNTGTIMRAETPNQLIGVIAHETGHIAGGHLSRWNDQMQGASALAIASMLLGIGAAIATGQGNALGAVAGVGQTLATANVLQFSRTQESSADQAGITFLDHTSQSPRGLLEFFETLWNQELLSASRQAPYLRTHPLTRERIDFVKNAVAQSRFADRPDAPGAVYAFQRVRAKLLGFTEPLGRTLQSYPETDNSEYARYARAIAYYRIPQLDRALALIDGLIAEHPVDPYYHELKGQMLFENGRGVPAMASYKEAVRLLPNSALLRVGLAQTELELDDPKLNADALQNLSDAVNHEPEFSLAWRLLGIVYGRENRIGDASLALAEQAIIDGRLRDAIQQSKRAQQLLPTGSPGWLRAQDLLQQAERERQHQRQQRG